MRLLSIIFGISCLFGCYQMRDGDDLRTVPVTNNPTIVPNKSQSHLLSKNRDDSISSKLLREFFQSD